MIKSTTNELEKCKSDLFLLFQNDFKYESWPIPVGYYITGDDECSLQIFQP